VHQLVIGRFGILGGRAWRLLATHRRLEEQQIATFSTAPLKRTRELLFNLARAGFISLQEIPKTSERHPGRTFYVWGVVGREIYREVMRLAFLTSLNLREKLESMVQARVAFVEREVKGRNLASTRVTTAAAKWREVALRMQNALNQSADMIMLFRDFEWRNAGA
jgi:DNA-directed RNA polymerase III subunit RPC3